jgi:CheY-like chemotaxis protein
MGLREERERGLAAGMDDFITKPPKYTQLKDVIERCFHQ